MLFWGLFFFTFQQHLEVFFKVFLTNFESSTEILCYFTAAAAGESYASQSSAPADVLQFAETLLVCVNYCDKDTGCRMQAWGVIIKGWHQGTGHKKPMHEA